MTYCVDAEHSVPVNREAAKPASRRGFLDVIGLTNSAEDMEQQVPTINERLESLLAHNETYQQDCPKLLLHLVRRLQSWLRDL